MRTFRTTLVATAAALLVACAEHPATTPDVASRAERIAAQNSTLDWLTGYLTSPHAPVAGEPAVLAGAGDIARCYPGSNVRQFRPPGADHPAQQTANLLDDLPGATVMAVGDNAYEFGSPLDY